MARTLSSIATFIFLFALAASAAPRAAAEDARVSNSPAVDNPFVSKQIKQQSATRAASGPQSFQNPFAERAAASPSLRSKQSGPMSRWRRPGATSSPAAIASTPPEAEFAPPQQAWDMLTPGELTRHIEQAATEEGDAPARFGQPPNPVEFVPQVLQQPSWLGAEFVEPDDERGNTKPAPIPRDGSACDANAPDSSDALLQSLQAARAMPTDPFDSATSKAGATGANAETTPTTADGADHSFDNLSAAESYARAQQVASEAQTLEQMSTVIALCRHGLSRHPARGEATSMRSLAAWAANRRGELLSDDGREDDALRSFEVALQLDPYCWLALHNRAVSRAQQGQVDAALNDFNRAIKLNPGLAVAYRNRGELLASLGRTDEAVADYSRAIEQLPQDSELRMMRGHALHRLGKYPQALEDLNRAIAIAPQDFDAYTHRGNIYAELGDYRQATFDFHQALRLNPESADAFRSVAWLLATCPDTRFRNPQKALAAAEQAARLAPPGDPFVLEAQAAAHACAGKFEQAVRYQQQAVSIAPEGFADQFQSRLALYQQKKPFRNSTTTHVVDTAVREASHNAPQR